MTNKFNTVIYTLSAVSLASTAVITKAFTDFDTTGATALTFVTLGLVGATVASMIAEIRAMRLDAYQRDLSDRFDFVERLQNDSHREILNQIEQAEMNVNRRIDEEVDSIYQSMSAMRNNSAYTNNKNTCKAG